MAFKKVTESQAAYLKAGFFGFQGAGKTRTATELAIGLHRYIKSQKPVGFLDTETGSDYVYPLFRKAGIELQVDKTKAFRALIEDLDAAVKEVDILIIDSITHYWREMVKAYKASRNARFLRIQDWGPLKEEWQQFTDRYINSPLHVIMCGRAANIFEDVEEDNDDSQEGNKKSWKAVKVGTKMSAETDTGYEPSLLVEMQKVMIGEGGKYLRRASVIKDRFGIIDSQEFDFSPEDKPGTVFACFRPHIELLNLGGEHLGVDTSQSSEALFKSPGTSITERRRQQQILTEELEGLLVSAFPGQSAKEKKAKADILQVAFNTRSWTAIYDFWPDKLAAGKDIVQYLCFSLAKAQEAQEEIPEGNDFLPWLARQREKVLVMAPAQN